MSEIVFILSLPYLLPLAVIVGFIPELLIGMKNGLWAIWEYFKDFYNDIQ